jgi:hypothetical protein
VVIWLPPYSQQLAFEMSQSATNASRAKFGSATVRRAEFNIDIAFAATPIAAAGLAAAQSLLLRPFCCTIKLIDDMRRLRRGSPAQNTDTSWPMAESSKANLIN